MNPRELCAWVLTGDVRPGEPRSSPAASCREKTGIVAAGPRTTVAYRPLSRDLRVDKPYGAGGDVQTLRTPGGIGVDSGWHKQGRPSGCRRLSAPNLFPQVGCAIGWAKPVLAHLGRGRTWHILALLAEGPWSRLGAEVNDSASALAPACTMVKLDRYEGERSPFCHSYPAPAAVRHLREGIGGFSIHSDGALVRRGRCSLCEPVRIAFGQCLHEPPHPRRPVDGRRRPGSLAGRRGGSTFVHIGGSATA